ncbi:MAG: hypothetical protein VST72_06905 [Nitrospirota bacterium]|nr:hypothetical protein [Nitrospirota bacterium]
MKKNEKAGIYQLCLNDEISYEGRKLHVQTEDIGVDKAQIVTNVFSGGQVLFSKATEYKDLLGKDDFNKVLVDRVRMQHRTILAGISAGKLKVGP